MTLEQAIETLDDFNKLSVEDKQFVLGDDFCYSAITESIDIVVNYLKQSK